MCQDSGLGDKSRYYLQQTAGSAKAERNPSDANQCVYESGSGPLVNLDARGVVPPIEELPTGGINSLGMNGRGSAVHGNRDIRFVVPRDWAQRVYGAFVDRWTEICRADLAK